MSTSKSSQQTPGGLRPARRSVVKGAAWAVPAVMVASAAPALAASPIPCVTLDFSATSCKCPGAGNSFTYFISVCFRNSCSTAITVTVTRLVSNSGVTLLPTQPETVVVPPGGQQTCTTTKIYTSTNSANFIDVFFTVNGGPEVSIRKASPPTCKDCPKV